MTVENTQNKMPPLQMGTTNEYPFTFAVLLQDPTEEEALEAIKASVLQADGTEIELVYNTDYTVTLNTDRIGGTLTVNDIRTSGDYITIYRQYAQTQEVDYKDFNSAPAETFEQCFDKLTMLSQQQQEEINRSIKLPVSSDITNLSLPNPVAGRTLKWNESETGLINSDVSIDEIDEFVQTAVEASANATEQAGIASEAAKEVVEKVSEVDNIWSEIVEGNMFKLQFFDTVVKDHILTYEESKGLAIQGTYVYKDSVAGSRYGYADFYNKVLEEYSEATNTETVNSVTVKVHANGHKFYNIADKDAIDEFFNTMGSAWFYGVDTENERIFLPRDKYFAVKGNVPVAGNGMTIGVSDGTTLGGLYIAGDGNVGMRTGSYGTDIGITSSGNVSSTKNIGITTDTTKSGIEGQLTANEGKYLYICVGNTEVKSAVTNVVDVTTTENDTLPLFTGQYFDFIPNHLSWLKGGRKAGESEYPTCYNELVNELASPKYGLKVIDESEMITGIDYSEYWKVNQDDMTFTAPTAISLKALDNIAPVAGNGMALGTRGISNGVEGHLESGSGSASCPGFLYATPYGGVLSQQIGVTTDPTKSGIEAHLVENSNAQLYFKVANAVQNLELLDVGKVMENAVLRSSLTECHVVVETYKNGASWYRVWSDGWCEQGGNGTLVSGVYTVTFLKPFVDTNYTALSIAVGSGDNFYFNNPNNIIDKTVSSMKIRIYNNSSLPSDWQASGYIW